jgi:hypothetical protein
MIESYRREEKKVEDKIILPSSDDAATLSTVTGWVSRSGHFFGNDEHLARYDGSTHRECEKCGKVISKHDYCRDCHIKREVEKYQKMERREWNETDAIYSQSDDRFFFDRCELDDYCLDNETTAEKLMLIICKPVYAKEIEPSEIYESDLPEEGDLPSDLQDAFDELNAFIRENKTILSWSPGKYAAIIA